MNLELSHALTLALLHFLWQGALIASLCAILLRLTTRSSAPLRYTIACLGLLAMPLAVAATIRYEQASSQPALLPSQPESIVSAFAPPTASTNPFSSSPPSAPLPTKPSFDEPWQNFRGWMPAVVLPLWIAGVMLFCIYRLMSWIVAYRMRRRGVCAVSAMWQQRLATLTGRLGLARTVVLLESSLTDTPLTMGALRPVILMPVGVLTGLPVEQIELILLHELAHIRRHDYLVNLMQSLVETLLFYHPAVWWLSKQIRAEREFCCDDIVVAVTSNGPTYARALANLEHQRDFGYSPAIAATGGNLVARIHRILGQPVATRNASVPIIGLLLLTIVTAAMAWQTAPIPTSSSGLSIKCAAEPSHSRGTSRTSAGSGKAGSSPT